MGSILTTVRGLLQRRRVEREMDDELRFHVELEIEANIARGMTPAAARRTALRDLGGVVQTQEAIRDVRALSIESVAQDAHHALRVLAARPGFAVATVGLLALAIGITTAMFTVVDALILRPAPFEDPDQLAFVYMGNERGGNTTVAPAVLRAWRETPAFAGAESAVPDVALIEAGGAVVTRGSARVSPGIFTLLGGVTPVRGRLFDVTEGRAGRDDGVLISEDVWRSLYEGDANIIGRRVVIDGEPLTVVGVLPADFRFPRWDTVIWRAVDIDALPAGQASERPMAYVRFASVPFADPVSWIVVLALVSVTLAIASWRPAREAMRLEPVVSLREE